MPMPSISSRSLHAGSTTIGKTKPDKLIEARYDTTFLNISTRHNARQVVAILVIA